MNIFLFALKASEELLSKSFHHSLALEDLKLVVFVNYLYLASKSNGTLYQLLLFHIGGDTKLS